MSGIKNKYKDFARTVHVVFTDFELYELDWEYIESLIDSGIIQMNDQNIKDFIEFDKSATGYFIETRLEEYKQLIVDGNHNITDEEVKIILHSDIDDKDNIVLIKYYRDDISIIGNKLSHSNENILEYIIENKFDDSDIDYLIQTYDNWDYNIQQEIKRIIIENYWDKAKELTRDRNISTKLEKSLIEYATVDEKIELGEIILKELETEEELKELLDLPKHDMYAEMFEKDGLF